MQGDFLRVIEKNLYKFDPKTQQFALGCRLAESLKAPEREAYALCCSMARTQPPPRSEVYEWGQREVGYKLVYVMIYN